MRTSVAWNLARPASRTDRTRLLLVTGTTAVAGALLLGGARIARLGVNTDVGSTWVRTGDGSLVQVFGGQQSDLAPYVSQSGLRPGVVMGAALLAVPVLALAVQGLRLGSVARERRLAALRLAGATPTDVRRVAALEAGTAAALGGLLAGPAYLGLWLVLGVLLSRGDRLLPAPGWLDVPFWLAVVLLASIAGAAAGWFLQGRTIVDPLGVRTRRSNRPTRRGFLRADSVTFLIGAFLLVASFVMIREGGSGEIALMAVAVLGLLVAVFAAAPRLVARRGRSLATRRGVANLLAGRRLTDDPRTTGRVCAVLSLCGVALGVEAVGVWDLVVDPEGENFGQDLSFYLTGYGLAAAGVAVAAAVAAVTLVVGVADQLTDARRPLAALRALGADEKVLLTAMRRQQTATAVPAVISGVVIGGIAFGLLLSGGFATLTSAVVIGVLLAWGLVTGVTRLAVRALRSRLVEATDPENLRVA